MTDGPVPPVRDSVSRLPPAAGRLPRTSWTIGSAAPLHLNEIPFPPSPRVIEAIRAHAHLVNRYPEPQPRALVDAIARSAGLAPDRVVVGAGSDELIQIVASVFLEPGLDAVMPAPAFPKYRQATLVAGARVIEVPLAADGACDSDALLRAITPATRIVFAATPNNPTGGAMPAHSVRRLAAGIPADAVLVVDEAYHEFARADGAPDILPILDEAGCSWIALRTFSKAHALAGLRVGYALAGSAALAEALLRVRPVFAPSYLAGVAALAALADQAYSDGLIAAIRESRLMLADRLGRLGLRVLPSAANFLAVDVGRDSKGVIETLAAAGILVAPIGAQGYEHFIRITIGTPDQVERVAAALEHAIQAARPAAEMEV